MAVAVVPTLTSCRYVVVTCVLCLADEIVHDAVNYLDAEMLLLSAS